MSEAAPPRPATRVGFGAKMLLALLTILVTFGMCEIMARMLFPAPPDAGRQPQIALRYDPEIRYIYAASQQGWIDDGFATINALGFRGHEVTVPKPDGRIRIVVIGDSVTFGWGVNDSDTYSAQFEQLLRRRFPGRDLDVINLGCGGYDTRQEVTLLRRHVSALQPDLVLVGFYSNDVPDALEDDAAPAPSGTRIAVENPQAGQILHMNPTPNSWTDRALRKSRTTYLLGRALSRFTRRGEWGLSRFSMEIDMLQGKDSPELDRAWGNVKRQFDALHSMAAEHGFSVGVVVLPPVEQVKGQDPNARYQSRVRMLAEPLGFFVIDPLHALAASPIAKDKLYIPYDRNHPSAPGHQIIGQAVFESLESRAPFSTAAREASRDR